MQTNANVIGKKLTELGMLLEQHVIKVTAIQELKLTSKSNDSRIEDYTIV